jgi:HlyD family secretion protein
MPGLPSHPADTAIYPGGSGASVRRHLVLSAWLIAALVLGVGGWATFTTFSGAVIAPGQLVVESEVKKVQHPVGGVIGALLVHEGDHVKAGDVLVRLDGTQARANLDIVRKALNELSARRARDEAERDNAATVVFPRELLAQRDDSPDVAALLDGESRLFAARVAGREGQRAQLSERAAQLTEEITGLTEQADAKRREIGLIGDELKGVRELYAKNLVPLSRVTALERDAARLEGERGQLVASVASARGRIAETRLQVLQIDTEMRTDVSKDLAEIRGKWAELVEKRVSAEDQLKRIEMRSPQDGVVYQMTVHTVGGLVVPSEPAMLIVPNADALVVEARIQPQDIDSVRLGQPALLRLTAFNARTTPEIDGTVARVSADVTADLKTGLTFYTVRIAISPQERARLGSEVRLVPGMPVEVHLRIGDRTVLSYLTKPLLDQIAKAWRER